MMTICCASNHKDVDENKIIGRSFVVAQHITALIYCILPRKSLSKVL